MTRPKKPATDTVKRIYALLIGGSFCFEDICKKTGLHRNTVASTLKYLKDRKMVSKEKKGRNRFYEIIKTQPPYFGWEISWIDLMTTDEDIQAIIEREEKKIEKAVLRRRTEENVLEFKKKIYHKLIEPEENQEFIKVLEKIEYPITLRLLLNNLQKPFCLNCLSTEKIFCRLILTSKNELACPKCGFSLQKMDYYTKPLFVGDQSEQKKLSKRMRRESKKPSYKRIQELLRKYKSEVERK